MEGRIMTKSSQMNVVLLEGNIVDRPEVRTISNGSRVGKLRLANHAAITRGDGEKEVVTFISAEGWNELADAVEGLDKGAFVRIEGRLRLSTWEDHGQKRSRVFVQIQSIWAPGMTYRVDPAAAGRSSEGGSRWSNRSGGRGKNGRSRSVAEDPMVSF
jgi:single stranded DNA-binding protein